MVLKNMNTHRTSLISFVEGWLWRFKHLLLSIKNCKTNTNQWLFEACLDSCSIVLGKGFPGAEGSSACFKTFGNDSTLNDLGRSRMAFFAIRYYTWLYITYVNMWLSKVPSFLSGSGVPGLLTSNPCLISITLQKCHLASPSTSPRRFRVGINGGDLRWVLLFCWWKF